MTGNSSFIDTGVLIGFSVLLDPHHSKCKRYLDDGDGDFYTSSDVREEYNHTKSKVINRLSSAVLDHLRDVKNHPSEDYLGPMQVDTIKKQVLRRSNDSYRFLYMYYDDVVNNGIQKQELEANLREIARDIDRMVASRENTLEPLLREWEQQDEHPEVKSSLEKIHNPDRIFAVQAHDLASNVNGSTEFATTNPSDFVYNGRRDLLLDVTNLDAIVDLSA